MMLTILLCAVAGCHEPVALIPSRPLRLTGGESWIQLVSRSPGDTIALAACDQGAAGSTALDVFVGPRCGALERHATVYLRCERWSVIRVELDERVHLRARGKFVEKDVLGWVAELVVSLGAAACQLRSL